VSRLKKSEQTGPRKGALEVGTWDLVQGGGAKCNDTPLLLGLWTKELEKGPKHERRLGDPSFIYGIRTLGENN